jgi:hypothetical protein
VITINVLSLFDGKYKVTEDGKILSTVGNEKELKGKVTKEGYRMVVFNVDKKKIYKNVHRLVAEAFIPNSLNLPEVNHIDGNKLNNHVDNLEWVTSKENQIHARDVLGANCKINMETANKIRELYSTGDYSHRELAKMFNIGKTQIGSIVNNKRWINND